MVRIKMQKQVEVGKVRCDRDWLLSGYLQKKEKQNNLLKQMNKRVKLNQRRYKHTQDKTKKTVNLVQSSFPQEALKLKDQHWACIK